MFLGMLVDARLVSKRKYYFIGCGAWTFLMQAAVGWKMCQDEKQNMILLVLNMVGLVFNVATIESIII